MIELNQPSAEELDIVNTALCLRFWLPVTDSPGAV